MSTIHGRYRTDICQYLFNGVTIYANATYTCPTSSTQLRIRAHLDPLFFSSWHLSLDCFSISSYPFLGLLSAEPRFLFVSLGLNFRQFCNSSRPLVSYMSRQYFGNCHLTICSFSISPSLGS